MKYILIFFLLFANIIYGHIINNENEILRHWKIESQNKTVEGSFSMFKNRNVYIEDANNIILNFPLSSFSSEDQNYITHKVVTVNSINKPVNNKTYSRNELNLFLKFIIIATFLILLSFLLFKFKSRNKLIYLIPIVCLGSLFTLFSFAKKSLSITDPAFVTSAFAPFTSTVSSIYDANFFYVNSKAIPNHTMMVGISNHGWQQQVPMAKCYINPNYWQFPLNPVLATTPVSVSAMHFTRGAIAIAVNGVPIFNPFTNTGVDAFLDGQLDNYGGHCGRGDDYHYHTAPLHLISLGQTTFNLPIAFAFDGFAVYGSLEPTGATMATLDANHGHYFNGIYHYHGTATAPYMIGNMVGQVTEDSSLQIIPQPQGNPVRTENWTPLNGALITSCIANSSNGYNTLYSLNGVSGYATNYTVSGTTYTFKYVTPTGITTTNYNGPAFCTVPNLNVSEIILKERNVTIYPNPASDVLNISLGSSYLENDVNKISIVDVKGSLVLSLPNFNSNIDIKKLEKGIYFVKIEFSKSVVTKKLLVK